MMQCIEVSSRYRDPKLDPAEVGFLGAVMLA